jgi:hypothetical protein
MDMQISTPVILFVVTLAFGFWLMRTRRPLNIAIFTIHKLAALAGVLLAGKTIYEWSNARGLPSLALILSGMMAVSVLALFISGAFLSREKPATPALLLIHRLAPAALVLSAGYFLYWFR